MKTIWQSIKNLNWGTIISISIVSLIFPAMLSLFNQQADITKTIFTTDYKNAKLKSNSCINQHRNYIELEIEKLGNLKFHYEIYKKSIKSIQLNKNFSVHFPDFLIEFQKNQNEINRKTKEAFDNTKLCYTESNLELENLSVSLGILEKYIELKNKYASKKCGNDSNCSKISKEIEGAQKKIEILQNKSNIKDFNMDEFTEKATELIISNEDDENFEYYNTLPTEELIKIYELKIQLEQHQLEFETLKQYELFNLVSYEMQRRFSQGFIRYFISSLW